MTRNHEFPSGVDSEDWTGAAEAEPDVASCSLIRTGSPEKPLARLRGAAVPEKGTVKIYTVSAGLTDAPSMEQPDKIKPIETTQPYARDLAVELKPYTVAVIEIVGRAD